MMNSSRTVALAAALIGGWLFTDHALADVKLPALFSDHMVLQRDATVPVWAWADPGEVIPVSVAGQTKTTTGEVTLTFDHTDGGLSAKSSELKGFAIAGADQKWVWAKARIAGNQVIVSSPEVKAPVAVRYAWANNPDCNLYNGVGLPASPFRTDYW